MKKILFALSASALMFASCSVLNSDPETEFTSSNYFTSEQNVEIFANYFYQTFTGYGSGSGDYYFNTLNDDQSSRGLTPWLYSNPSATNSLWNTCYEEIRRANTLIEAIPGIASMAEPAKNNWLGVARLYRAWQHYKLVRAFGDCYYVDHVLNTDDEILKAARTDRDIVMDKVLEDLNFAVENITYNEDSRVAFNKYVANAMKAEVCLYEGTFCKYRSAADQQKAPDAARASKYLDECVKACEVITGNTAYDLNGNDVSGYQANFNSFDLKGNPEMILYKHYELGIMAHGTIDYTCGSTPVIGMTKDAFDSYLFRDGKTAAATTLDTNDKGVVLNIKAADGHCDTDHDVIDISAVLATRDPRLSVQVDHIVHFVDHGYARFGGAESTSTTGYGVLLFDVPVDGTTEANWNNTNRQSTNGNWTDAPIFWLGNVLLNYAEACAELNYTDKATAAIDRLRTRVGMPGIAATDGDLLTNVRRERRCEMMYCMNDRYWSLIRWHQLNKLDVVANPDVAKGAWVGSLAGTSVDVDANGYIVTLNGNTRQYGADGYKHYLYPIPTNEITLNPAIGQNPGW
ncbi:MAG: RagB/SusD family nutrient uptake outer membrane protein [Paludibacteraceae bacterium]|nr:RagB/SusD family nutrient uptake outer membrane protein [Paludibacteraceae bacterium]